ncbi:DNA-directed RNA polymerase subunit alpha (plasmid) [Pontibacillus sp. ALD_SL1]|uniref:DNA-directed RNA polymerase subunit alpha n=1 Tax=Pontibacillus sp. ALD_SL1 TaxID=2777185 RepID=UPI001A97B6DC|nr:DNA-directed RNA polymerase subunit alpha [Pontibacillus sp. ALD_SL1]QST03085.1 DNA-directed RNA polymerase subunit alpha [Pontibacillus sp. ALD_SL1]
MNLDFEKPSVYCNEEEKPFCPVRVEIEPVAKGFGVTIGNSLRRILYSSILGSSVIGVKIDGVSHTLDVIKGASTDALGLVLRLKEVRFKNVHDDMQTVRFNKKKAGHYYARDLEVPSGIEVTNPDQPLISLTGDQEVSFEAYVNKGRGTVYADHQTLFQNRPDIIEIDALYSPVIQVGYETEEVRMGHSVDHERLIMHITTDGSITAKDAVQLAAKINIEHFTMFNDIKDMVEKTKVFKEKQEEENLVLDAPIEDLELSQRSYNCLKKAKIQTVRKILEYTVEDLYHIPQMGRKSVEEVVAKMESLGFELNHKP